MCGRAPDGEERSCEQRNLETFLGRHRRGRVLLHEPEVARVEEYKIYGATNGTANGYGQEHQAGDTGVEPMSLGEDNRICLEKQIKTTVHELEKAMSNMHQNDVVVDTYTHVNRQSDQHRLLEEYLERHDEDPLCTLSDGKFVHLQWRVETVVAGLLAKFLRLLLQENRFVCLRERQERDE